MRVLAAVALVGVLFASTEAHAIVVKDKKKRKPESAYAESAESKTQYDKTTYNKRSLDRYTSSIRHPDRTGRVKPAPKKFRKRSHITELP